MICSFGERVSNRRVLRVDRRRIRSDVDYVRWFGQRPVCRFKVTGKFTCSTTLAVLLVNPGFWTSTLYFPGVPGGNYRRRRHPKPLFERWTCRC